MPSIINTVLTATHSSHYVNFVPESGANRLHLIYVFTEMTGSPNIDQLPGTYSYNGQAYTRIKPNSALTSTLRGLTVFVAKESEILSIEAGSGGAVGLADDGVTNYFANNATSAFAVTVADANQSVDVNAISVIAGPLGTGDVFPHPISVPALTNDLVIVASLMTQDDTTTWGGATEIDDLSVSGSWNMSLASVVAASDGDVDIDVTADGGTSYATLLLGIAIPAAVVAPATVSITNVSRAAAIPNSDLVVTLADGTGPYTASYHGEDVAINSQSATTITFNSWDYPWERTTDNVDFNADYDLVITDTGDSNNTSTVSLQTTTAANESVYTAAGSPYDANSLHSLVDGLVDGDRVWWYQGVGSGVLVATNGDVSNGEQDDTIKFRAWDVTDSSWSLVEGTYTVSIQAPVVTITDAADTALEYANGSGGILESDASVSAWLASFTNSTSNTHTPNDSTLIAANSPYTYTFSAANAVDVTGILTVTEAAVVSVPPTIVSPSIVTLDEEVSTTTDVVVLAATGTGSISWTITGGIDAANYEIYTGFNGDVYYALRRKTPADYETNNQEFVEVTATGDAAPPAVQSITININDTVEPATVAPTITPTAGTTLALDVGDAYSDPAWTHADDVVSGLAVTWSWVGSAIDINAAGTYTRRATATNAIGTVTLDLVITVSDVVGPILSTIELITTGQAIYLHFDQNISFGSGGKAGLSISGTTVTIDSLINIFGTYILTLNDIIYDHETITLSYTNPGDGLQNADGVLVADFVDFAILNESSHSLAATVAPTIVPSAGTSITLTLGDSYSDPADWTWADDVVSDQPVSWSWIGSAIDINVAGEYTRRATATNNIDTTTQAYTVNVVTSVQSEGVESMKALLSILPATLTGHYPASFWQGNTHIFQIKGLQKEVSGEVIADATLRLTLSIGGDNLPGVTWPLEISAVSGSSGDYKAVVPGNLSVTEGDLIDVLVTAVAGDGSRAQWESKLMVRDRIFL